MIQIVGTSREISHSDIETNNIRILDDGMMIETGGILS